MFMKNRFLNTASGIALGLLVAVAPAYSATATTLSFSVTNLPAAGAGSVNFNGSTGTPANSVTSISGIEINQVWIQNAPNAADDGIWTLTGTAPNGDAVLAWSSGSLTIQGTFGACTSLCGGGTNLDTGGTAVSGTLASGTIAALPYGSTPGFTTTSSSVNVQFGTSTSLTETANHFLADLGFVVGGTASSLSAGSYVIGTCPSNGSCVTSGSNAIAGSSEALDVTIVATPEPVSFFLLGSGLLGIGLVARKRSVRN